MIAERAGRSAPAALRVNPDVDAGTHAKISTGKAENKFGVPIDRAEEIFADLSQRPGLDMRGLAVHIGSQLSSLDPFEKAFARVGALVETLRSQGHAITHVDLGGGLGVPYKAGEVLPSPAEYGAMVARVTRGWDVRLMFEPGRVIAGNAGVLLTRVIRVKRGGNGPPFVIVDAAMNDLARPALYDAWHDFDAVRPIGRADDRQYRRPDLRDRRHFRHRTAISTRSSPGTSRCSAPPAPMARRWPELQQPRLRGRSAWSTATSSLSWPTASRPKKSPPPSAYPTGSNSMMRRCRSSIAWPASR